MKSVPLVATSPGRDPDADAILAAIQQTLQPSDGGDDRFEAAMVHVEIGEIVDRIRALLGKADLSETAADDLRYRVAELLGFEYLPEPEMKDPSILNWRHLLRDPFSSERFTHWRDVYEFWKANQNDYVNGVRRLLNTFEMPFAELERKIHGLIQTADQVVDLFFSDFCPEKGDLKAKFGLDHEVRDARTILDLLRLIYEHPNHSETSRFDAYRKIAIALLIRQIHENPRWKNRREDTSRFEHHLLRDDTGLINPVVNYENVPVWFRPKPDVPGQCDICFETIPNEPSPEWERAALYRIPVSGRVSPVSNERVSITVYAFPGNKNAIDAQETPGLTIGQRSELSRKPSIVSYKTIEATALKIMRTPDIVKDLARCTLLTETPEEARLLQEMLQVELGSAMSQVKRGKRKSNRSTSPDYRGAHQVVEDLHNEKYDRNYYFEFRIGTLADLMIDKSTRVHSASHDRYRRRRSIIPGKILFPALVYPEMALEIGQTEEELVHDGHRRE